MLGALPLLVALQMLRSEDPGVHYEAVGVIGNLVHSSQDIKQRVLEVGGWQRQQALTSSTFGMRSWQSQKQMLLCLLSVCLLDGCVLRVLAGGCPAAGHQPTGQQLQ
jgi:hypothetical protein